MRNEFAAARVVKNQSTKCEPNPANVMPPMSPSRANRYSRSSCDAELRDEVDIETARERLLEERLRVEELLGQVTTDGVDERVSALEQGDMTDSAGPLIAEQESDAVLEGLRARLDAIKRAQQRLDDGTYGRSIRSGRTIPDDRLEADPAAELTLDEL